MQNRAHLQTSRVLAGARDGEVVGVRGSRLARLVSVGAAWPAVASAAGQGRGARHLLLALGAAAALGCFDSRRFAFVDIASNQPAPDAGTASSPGAASPSLPIGPALPLGPAPTAPGLDAGAIGTSPEPPAVPGPSLDAGSLPPVAALCALPETAQPGAVLYGGPLAGGACPTSLASPYAASWFSYQDNGDALAVTPSVSSCDPSLCSLRVEGPTPGNPGYSASGAGLALPLSPDDTPVDLSRFTGIQFSVRGTLDGTRGLGAADAPQTLFFKLVTATPRGGDDFGVFCQLDPNEWSVCRAEFAAFAREGFAAPDPALDVFDLQSSLRAEFEFRLFRDALGVVPVPVSVAIELAQISFF